MLFKILGRITYDTFFHELCLHSYIRSLYKGISCSWHEGLHSYVRMQTFCKGSFPSTSITSSPPSSAFQPLRLSLPMPRPLQTIRPPSSHQDILCKGWTKAWSYQLSTLSARPFDRLFAHWVTSSFTSHSSLRPRAPLRSFVCLLTPELMEKWFLSVNWMRRFPTISTHSAMRR